MVLDRLGQPASRPTRAPTVPLVLTLVNLDSSTSPQCDSVQSCGLEAQAGTAIGLRNVDSRPRAAEDVEGAL
jgi:hypothetical protein